VQQLAEQFSSHVVRLDGQLPSDRVPYGGGAWFYREARQFNRIPNEPATTATRGGPADGRALRARHRLLNAVRTADGRIELVGPKKSRSFRNTDVGPADLAAEWPRPVHDRQWIDSDGTSWRMRGRPLQAKQARRLTRRADVQVVRAYGFEVVEVLGGERDALLTRIEEFFAGQAPPFSNFILGEFRDRDHRVMLMVQESC
jgi:hypothetical protein